MKLKNVFTFCSLIFLLLFVQACGQKKKAYSSRSSSVKAGKTYKGMASWYGKRYHGRTMANGRPYNMYKMTAAHKKLPFGTKVRVTNLSNNKSVVVMITDRGPYAKGRIIDVSKKAAQKLGVIRAGVTKVKIKILN